MPRGHRRAHLINDKIFHSPLTRITDFERAGFDRRPLPWQQWAAGDYVVGTATIPRGGLSGVELTTGRMVEAVNGDMVLGALGVRHATLEAVGSWEAVSADGRMHLLSAGGLLGRLTSVSGMLASPMRIDYAGHAVRNGTKVLTGPVSSDHELGQSCLSSTKVRG